MAGGKGGGQGHKWPQPQQLPRQPLPGSPPKVSAALRADQEREGPRQQTAQYEVLTHLQHQRSRRQAPSRRLKTILQLEMEVEREGAESKGKNDRARGRRGGQISRGPQGEEVKARRRKGTGAGTRGGGSGGHTEGQATGGGEG